MNNFFSRLVRHTQGTLPSLRPITRLATEPGADAEPAEPAFVGDARDDAAYGEGLRIEPGRAETAPFPCETPTTRTPTTRAARTALAAEIPSQTPRIGAPASSSFEIEDTALQRPPRPPATLAASVVPPLAEGGGDRDRGDALSVGHRPSSVENEQAHTSAPATPRAIAAFLASPMDAPNGEGPATVHITPSISIAHSSHDFGAHSRVRAAHLPISEVRFTPLAAAPEAIPPRERLPVLAVPSPRRRTAFAPPAASAHFTLTGDEGAQPVAGPTSIEVHIGRIEVQGGGAAPPRPGASAKPKLPRPRVDLARYAAQRDTGRRS